MKGDVLTACAPAKVNLSLEVIGRRQDGYHDIATIVQKITLPDRIEVEPAERLSVWCSRPDLHGEENLVFQAARLLRQRCGVSTGANIRIHKRIPVAAGLGGGASNAAVALVLLNKLWNAGLSVTELCEVGVQIGSDIPAMILGPTALVEGRGDLITPLASPRRRWLALVTGQHNLANKTKDLYARLTGADFTHGEIVTELTRSLDRGGDFDETHLYNVFWRAALQLFPGLTERAQTVSRLTGRPAHLAGAGPTLFCLFDRREDARAASAELAKAGIVSIVAATLSR